MVNNMVVQLQCSVVCTTRFSSKRESEFRSTSYSYLNIHLHRRSRLRSLCIYAPLFSGPPLLLTVYSYVSATNHTCPPAHAS